MLPAGGLAVDLPFAEAEDDFVGRRISTTGTRRYETRVR